MPEQSSPLDFEHMFDLAPVSLWLEDYSTLKRLFDQWRADGITDFNAHVRQAPELIAQCATCLKVLKVNRRTLELFAAASQDELVSQLSQVFRDDMLEQFIEELAQLWDGQPGFSNQTVNYALDGRRLDIQIHARILQGHESSWDRVLVSLEDITVRVQAERQQALSAQYARNLFEYSPVSLWVEDFSTIKRLIDEVRARGIQDFRVFMNVHPEFVSRCMQEIRVIDVNRQTLHMFGASSKESLFKGLNQIFRDEMRDSFAEQLMDLWQGKTEQQREVVNYSLSGELINIHLQFSVLEGHEARWDMVLVSLVDITARKKAEAYLEYLGKHDTLTQLRNRAYYVEELNRLSRKGPWPLSVIAIDLNGLKRINDEGGHVAGDALLRRAGEVLAKTVDAPDCAARIGGDEFMILLPGSDERAALDMMERIASLVELNNQFYPGQSLSLAMGSACCRSGEQMEATLHEADRLMYAQKSRYYSDQQLDRRHA